MEFTKWLDKQGEYVRQDKLVKFIIDPKNEMDGLTVATILLEVSKSLCKHSDLYMSIPADVYKNETYGYFKKKKSS